MIRSIILKKIITIFILCFISVKGWSASIENTVVVEIDTVEMTDKKVENVIAEPIELLLGSLDEVLMVSAKYLPNKAIINVEFTEDSAEPEALITRVKTTINSYMEKLPDSINSISVSLGEPSENLSTESEAQSESGSSNQDVKDQKKNRNNSAADAATETEEEASSSESSSALKNQIGVIKRVEKRVKTGRYLGSIESSNEYLPVITTLIPASSLNDDVAGGKYFMSEQDEIIVGNLSNCYNNSGDILTCQWRDKYGTGGVDFIFTPDYTSFNGRWSINGKEGAYKWSGLKVKDK